MSNNRTYAKNICGTMYVRHKDDICCHAEVTMSFSSQTMVTGITHHRYRNEFITCGERVLLWDANVKAPKFSYDWGTTADRNEATFVSVRFNPVESDLFGEWRRL